MSGIVINIDPVALHIGRFMLNWYSIIIILAIIAAVFVALKEAKRKGIPADTIYSLVPWVLVGGIVGARLFHVIDWWKYYAGNPLQIFAIWQGGLAIWGALFGGGVAAVVFSRVKQISFCRLADALVPALLVAQVVGRFACIIDGDAAGGVTSLPWAFIYINPGAMVPPGLLGVPVHPYPVYDQIWNLLVLAAALNLRQHFKTDGLLFFGYLAIYGVGRFVLSFVRQENIWFWGLQEAQVVAIAIIIASLVTILYLGRRSRIRVLAEASG